MLSASIPMTARVPFISFPQLLSTLWVKPFKGVLTCFFLNICHKMTTEESTRKAVERQELWEEQSQSTEFWCWTQESWLLSCGLERLGGSFIPQGWSRQAGVECPSSYSSFHNPEFGWGLQNMKSWPVYIDWIRLSGSICQNTILQRQSQELCEKYLEWTMFPSWFIFML